MKMKTLLCLCLAGSITNHAIAQQPGTKDSTSLSLKKKNPFLIYTGKTIRQIRINNVGFEGDVNNLNKVNGGFGVTIGNALHKNTTIKIIENNLLFKTGEKLNPFLLADNERHLRDLSFIQDALIVVQPVTGDPGTVDLLVIVKDGFSLLPGLGIGGTNKFNFELKEENIAGSGAKIAVNSLYDNNRDPRWGFGGEFQQRNVKGTFINWGVGFKNWANAFNSNRNEENTYYLRIEKPLVSQYLRWMGALDLSYNKTSNAYISDSAYRSDFRYAYYNADGWFAFNFGAGRMKYKNQNSTVRKFVAVRAFHKSFRDKPEKTTLNYDGTYTNTTGVLASLSLFKQNFFRATYIYGFGRNEDVPEGYTASLVGGYVLGKDSLYAASRTRPYFGMEAMAGKYNKKGFYSAYTFRIGGYRYKGKWEDFDLLLNGDHFTRLRKLNANWYKRFFFSGGIAKQFTPVLEQSLFLRSPYGLPYFEYGYVNADFRATIKTEAVFYHTKRALGFGFAPFGFADLSLLKPTKQALGKSDLYSGIGAGFRIRNENLLFGTIEARFSYLPRTIPGMGHFRVKFNTNLRYKYNSTFIRRPDFVNPNGL